MTLEERFKAAVRDGKELRGAPFWSWNDDLDPEELRRQVREMREKGFGGFFMHARIGLITPYMGDKWMECIAACVDEARKAGMDAWLYDEDCWPSGSCGGLVTAMGPEYPQKWVSYEEVEAADYAHGEDTLAVFVREKGAFVPAPNDVEPGQVSKHARLVHFSLNAGGYVDVLNAKAVRAFIDSTHERYLERVGAEFAKAIPGIFTDEPQYHCVPWSPGLAKAFMDRHGYSLLGSLPSLFFDTGNFHKVRYDFWSTVTEIYVGAFSRQIGEWCERHGIALTGHQMAEDTLQSQIMKIGAAMPHYEYMQMPGIDHLCRRIADPLLPKQVSSVAHQFGGRRVLSETYGCSGWNMSFEDQKWIGDWQYALGVDLLCPHLSLYSLRGCRKRDFPPSIFYQQPWWPDYKIVQDHFARLGTAVTAGKHVADVLLLHPIGSAWAIFNPQDASPVGQLNAEFSKLSELLLQMHVDYDYGDELIMERHARVEDGKLLLGTCSYSVVVVPPSTTWRKSTVSLLREFAEAGGSVIAVGERPTMVEGVESREVKELFGRFTHVSNEYEDVEIALRAVVPTRIAVLSAGEDAKTVYVQQRDLGGRQLFFLANVDKEHGIESSVEIPGVGLIEEWDLETGEVRPVPAATRENKTCAALSFAPAQSRLISFDSGKPPLPGRPETRTTVAVQELEGPWILKTLDPNALTLDHCEYRVNGGEWSGRLPVIWVQEELSKRDGEFDVGLRFRFTAGFRSDRKKDMRLVLETPETFRITLNEAEVNRAPIGCWVDISFEVIDIDDLVRSGENVLELSCRFKGQAGLAARMEDKTVHESERNRLKHGTELESCYIIGDFSVFQPEENLFVLRDAVTRAESGDLVEQGFPFYCGKVLLSRDVEVQLEEGARVLINFEQVGAIVTKVKVNGSDAGMLVWRPLELDITDLVRTGTNRVEIELTNSCRNLLGPHHHVGGELFGVGPDSFKGTPGWLDRGKTETTWVDRYNFVEFGLTAPVKLVQVKCGK